MKLIRPVCEHGESSRRWENLIVPPQIKAVGDTIDSLRQLIPQHVPAPLPPVVIQSHDLQLKKLKVSLELSQETTCFAAEVWRKGRSIGYARNTGNGGATLITPTHGMGDLEEADEWARALPPESSYRQLYRSMLLCDPDYRDVTEAAMKDIGQSYWFTTSAMRLETLVDYMADVEAERKSVRALNAYVVVGPRVDQRVGAPVTLKYPKALTRERAIAVQASLIPPYRWAYMLSAVYELPFHYYPAPHPFSGTAWPKQEVVVGDRQFTVEYGTNDLEVVIGHDEGDVLSVDPSRVRFAEELVEMAESDRRIATRAHANIDPEDGCLDCGYDAK